jgi:hypothetical protein
LERAVLPADGPAGYKHLLTRVDLDCSIIASWTFGACSTEPISFQVPWRLIILMMSSAAQFVV